MQKLKERPSKNTPKNTSLVLGNCDLLLNNSKEIVNSVIDLKTSFNNSEVNLPQRREGLKHKLSTNVYVISIKGKPLMPCSPQKAKKLLKEKKAHVINRKPFTIQLDIVTGENKQNITLGIDIGYKNIGLSAITEKKEVYASEVKLRTDIVKLNSERKMYRVNRRGRSHWYRPARFLNRKKPKGWLAPSIQHKIDSHIRIANQIYKILPISKVIVEVAKFDIQKIKNPEINRNEYQEGDQLGFANVREYILHRDNHQCQNCKKSKDIKLQVHHIESRMIGGNRSDNLITLCRDCHDKYHAGKIKISLKKSKSYKEATCMNIIRNRIVDGLKKIFSIVEITYGYITKFNRKMNNVEKSHLNDAFIISGGSDQKRCFEYKVEQRRINNRCLQLNRKGFKPSVRRQRYKLQPKSLVKFGKKVLEVIGVHCYGKSVILRDKKKIDINIKKIKLIKYNEGLNYV